MYIEFFKKEFEGEKISDFKWYKNKVDEARKFLVEKIDLNEMKTEEEILKKILSEFESGRNTKKRTQMELEVSI